MLKPHLSRWCLAGLVIAGLVAAPSLFAQDEAEKSETAETPAEQKPYDVNPVPDKPLTAAEKKAEEDRRKALKNDNELRGRLENTIWNDVDLRAGEPGQLWMLRPAKQVGQRVERAWYLNDSKGLPRVGSWDVKNGEVLLTAMNGTLIGRGKYKEDEIIGKFIDPDRRREYGQFRLREETKRNYRVLTMRENNTPRRRK